MKKLLALIIIFAICFPDFSRASKDQNSGPWNKYDWGAKQKNPFDQFDSEEQYSAPTLSDNQNSFQYLIDKAQKEKKDGMIAAAFSFLSFVAMFAYIRFKHPNKNGWIRLCTVLSVIVMAMPVGFLFFYTDWRDIELAFILSTPIVWFLWLALFAIGWIKQGFKKDQP